MKVIYLLQLLAVYINGVSLSSDVMLAFQLDGAKIEFNTNMGQKFFDCLCTPMVQCILTTRYANNTHNVENVIRENITATATSVYNVIYCYPPDNNNTLYQSVCPCYKLKLPISVQQTGGKCNSYQIVNGTCSIYFDIVWALKLYNASSHSSLLDQKTCTFEDHSLDPTSSQTTSVILPTTATSLSTSQPSLDQSLTSRQTSEPTNTLLQTGSAGISETPISASATTLTSSTSGVISPTATVSSTSGVSTPFTGDTITTTPSNVGTTVVSITPSVVDTTLVYITPSVVDTTLVSITPSVVGTTVVSLTPSTVDTTVVSLTPSTVDTTVVSLSPSVVGTTSLLTPTSVVDTVSDMSPLSVGQSVPLTSTPDSSQAQNTASASLTSSSGTSLIGSPGVTSQSENQIESTNTSPSVLSPLTLTSSSVVEASGTPAVITPSPATTAVITPSPATTAVITPASAATASNSVIPTQDISGSIVQTLPNTLPALSKTIDVTPSASEVVTLTPTAPLNPTATLTLADTLTHVIQTPGSDSSPNDVSTVQGTVSVTAAGPGDSDLDRTTVLDTSASTGVSYPAPSAGTTSSNGAQGQTTTTDATLSGDTTSTKATSVPQGFNTQTITSQSTQPTQSIQPTDATLQPTNPATTSASQGFDTISSQPSQSTQPTQSLQPTDATLQTSNTATTSSTTNTQTSTTALTVVVTPTIQPTPSQPTTPSSLQPSATTSIPNVTVPVGYKSSYSDEKELIIAITVGIVGSVLLLLTLVVGVFCWRRRQERKYGNMEPQSSSDSSLVSGFSPQSGLTDDRIIFTGVAPRYPYYADTRQEWEATEPPYFSVIDIKDSGHSIMKGTINPLMFVNPGSIDVDTVSSRATYFKPSNKTSSFKSADASTSRGQNGAVKSVKFKAAPPEEEGDYDEIQFDNPIYEDNYATVGFISQSGEITLQDTYRVDTLTHKGDTTNDTNESDDIAVYSKVVPRTLRGRPDATTPIGHAPEAVDSSGTIYEESTHF